ncbi:FAD-dependent oxidoreductase [Streptomonospora nanhaiensis]|uniref:Assimilatory nitrate reductase electron transfer subunit n=1 Tax=Streptomonospora nanhaiensis TaxID=1323731 RepID=A0A853BIF6_9ACTN|nr:FAD-dependent oxidoreductase [Streptomonospora nanhaiensis]MBV2366779.1 FAD-dependent oxidoreductase [Streptomonospora nanhaiensis]MBX9391061.1 FAD-dependent oxidoreductase [Streptomonospora nanhaiensis]NYI94391.1 assimilatory nitrate reductase electron transfer subunit [Streptomonospora nanhaiensis]
MVTDTDTARHVVVIGNGMTGARFAEEVARRDPRGERLRVSVVGEETEPAYNRVLLPGVLAGRYAPEDIRLPVPETGAVSVRTGVAAVTLDTERRRVRLDDGTALDYDELVLATGARAAFPPVQGLASPDGTPEPGVTALRDLADCRRLAALARPGGPVVVLGGGVLGLEAARALTERGMRVSLVESAPWIMRRQIDQPAAQILAHHYTRLGVAVHSWRVAARWIPGTGLELDDGRLLAGDALVVTAGVRANTELAEAAGIEVDRGVLVDDTLATSDPRVHAIGDCAQHPGGGGGLVQPGWEQAAVLADLLTGTRLDARYTGARPVTRLKAEGIELTSMGDPEADDTAETVTIADPHGGRYAKLSVRDDRVVGAVLLGLPEPASAIAQLYDGRAPVPGDRLALLMGRAQPEAPADQPGPAPLVCRCNAVSRDDMEAAWLDGARTRDAMARATRATTGCGGCTRDVDALLSGWNGREPIPTP